MHSRNFIFCGRFFLLENVLYVIIEEINWWSEDCKIKLRFHRMFLTINDAQRMFLAVKPKIILELIKELEMKQINVDEEKNRKQSKAIIERKVKINNQFLLFF